MFYVLCTKGNGPSTQYPRGGGPKKRTIRKKPYNNSTGEKNTDISSSVKGKGPRQKFYPNKTVVFNRSKNKFKIISLNTNIYIYIFSNVLQRILIQSILLFY